MLEKETRVDFIEVDFHLNWIKIDLKWIQISKLNLNALKNGWASYDSRSFQNGKDEAFSSLELFLRASYFHEN